MELLEGAEQNYEWGSPTAIPTLLGRPGSDRPVAELWLGAHPAAPARVGAAGIPLDEVISADPDGALGSAVASRFGGLPFLFKIIAADEPLSLQAHPDQDQAAAGYDREEEAGIPRDAPERFYRDRSHKPELICALSTFDALCGFRDPASTLDLLATIETAALDPMRHRMAASSDGAGLHDALGWALTLDPAAAAAVTAEVVEACTADGPDLGRAERAVTAGLARRYPGDAGAVVGLMLNLVSLEPGEALFLRAGTLHCYLGGVGAELMANSDNVLRGGLTTKPIDVGSLLEVVDTTPVPPPVQRPLPVEGVARYDSPVPEFSLTRLDIDGSDGAEVAGPAVLLCVSGVVDAGERTLDRGTAAWMTATEQPVPLSGTGTIFRAGVGDLALH